MRPILGGQMPVVNPSAAPAPAVTQPPAPPVPAAQVPAPSSGGIKTLLKDPYRLQLLMSGLGMMFSDTERQQQAHMGNINQALLDRSRWEREAPEREKADRLRKLTEDKAEREAAAYEQYQSLLAKLQGGEIGGAEFATEIMGLPGYESVGASLAGKYADADADTGAYTSPDGTVWKDRNQYQSALLAAKKNVTPLANQITESRGNFESIVASAQVRDGPGRGAADQAMIFSFAKMLDPRSVVRTEEGQAIARTDGYFGALQGFLKQIEGKGALSGDARRGLVEEAYRQLTTKNMPVYERLAYENAQSRGMFGDLTSPDVLAFPQWAESYKLPSFYGEGAPGHSGIPLIDAGTVAAPPPGYDPATFDPADPSTWPPPPE